MFKLGGLGVVLMLVFAFWISFASDPHARFDRACAPVDKFGNFVTSFIGLFFDRDWAAANDAWFERADYGCEYMLWRLWYEDDYQQQLQDDRLNGEQAPQSGEQGGIILEGDEDA